VNGADAWSGAAPAKVNLLLRVLAREAGGHHQLETVFQALELSDEVHLERTREPGVRLDLEGVAPGELGPDASNLAVRAARAYLEALGPGGQDRGGVQVRLEKRIPHGAGLGGGSSDAGTVLRGMDVLHGGALGLPVLVELGAALGADVPFFALDRPRALGWGRGDRLLPLPPLPVREVVLACPPEPIATPWAYRMLAEHREAAGMGSAGGALVDPGRLGSWEGVAEAAENAFQAALEPLRPDLARLREALSAAGAVPALLSGSGSAVFGVFRSSAEAAEGVRRVERAVPGTRAIRTRTRG
jgi:4-diphosphocytidyl-2-C-methyl-D-erythritol kinase